MCWSRYSISSLSLGIGDAIGRCAVTDYLRTMYRLERLLDVSDVIYDYSSVALLVVSESNPHSCTGIRDAQSRFFFCADPRDRYQLLSIWSVIKDFQ